MSKPYTTLSIAVVTLLLGLGGGYWLAHQATPSDTPLESASSAQREPLFYRHPMNPEISSPVPAKDEMGMDYIPVYADDDESDAAEPAGTVKISPAVVQNIGVRTAKVEKRSLDRAVNAVGRVAFNEEYLTRLHPKVEGWIEQLYIDKTGEPVNEDTILLNLYSPKLVTTQQEYLLALRGRRSLQNAPFPDIREGGMNLAKTARERLELFDVLDHQIRELEKTGRVEKDVCFHR
jgi:Cu(I)/Ag(I) efflux system membrane fusion protein